MTSVATDPSAGSSTNRSESTGDEPPPVGSRESILSVVTTLMGGEVGIHLAADSDDPDAATRDARRLLARIGAWADRLTRFDTGSDLSRLNADRRSSVPVRATLSAVLDWGRQAESMTSGIVDIALLDARLGAERGLESAGGPQEPGHGELGRRSSDVMSASRSWSIERRARGATVHRPLGVRFDLDGIGKGWIADRALERIAGHRSAIVDADGDVALRVARRQRWSIGVSDPRQPDRDLAVLTVRGLDSPAGGSRFGLATSGTTVHRWTGGTGVRHHLIDPRTGLPADTDVIQATVLARSARVAEAWAKTAVILGSAEAIGVLNAVDIEGALLLTDRDELVVTPPMWRWLA